MMATTQYIFRRYEKKYLLTRSQFHEMREALAPYMTDDEYGLHTINNITRARDGLMKCIEESNERSEADGKTELG